jgi:predicted NAD/FAD-binding protein
VRPRIAVVGAGVAGISAAYHLRDQADVTVFEADNRPGGHAYTVQVDDHGVSRGLDTAFIVFNHYGYPNITKFFAELGTETSAHAGRFCFFDFDTCSNYVSEDFELTEDEVAQRYTPEFTHLWREAKRFQKEGFGHFLRKQADLPLGEYLDKHGYSDEFRYGFIVLISTAAWSVPAEIVWQMPASTVIAFFCAHGIEGLGGQSVPWRTVTNGSVNYVNEALKRVTDAGGVVRLGTPVQGVLQHDGGVTIRSRYGAEQFDQVVLACHADDSMAMLENPTPRQRMLEVVKYHPTRATLHTDPAVMPADRDVWRSWNYGRMGRGADQRSWVVYYLNMLQGFESQTEYFVTLDPPMDIPDERIIEDIYYRHPVFNVAVRRLQADIYSVNEGSLVKFAGSYFHAESTGPDTFGSHETGFASGASAAASALRDAGQLPKSA